MAWTVSEAELEINRSAYVYRKTAHITDTRVKKVLAQLNKSALGSLKGKQVRKNRTVGGTSITYTFAGFLIEKRPPFLGKATTLRDRVHGFFLLVEVSEHLVMFQARVPNATKLLKLLGDPVEFSVVSRALETADSAFEKLAFRDMSPSQHTIQHQSVEADDLKNSLSLQGSGRSIPSALRIRNADDKQHSVSPATSRMGTLGGRATLAPLLKWAIMVVDAVEAYTPGNSYLDYFAAPVSLKEILADTTPAAVLLDARELVDLLEKENHSLAVANDDGDLVSYGKAKTTALLDKVRLTHPLAAKKTPSGKDIYEAAVSTNLTLTLRPKTKLISLDSKAFRRLWIVDSDDSGTETLQQHFNGGRLLVTFEDPTYAYFHKRAFRDTNLLNTLPALLESIETLPALATATCEKFPSKTFPKSAAAFPTDSIFGIMEKHLETQADLVVLDDLGDEWADHISLTGGNSPEITFFHEKHTDDTTGGASPLQVVVAQALKNLGRLYLSDDAITNKLNAMKNRGTFGQTKIRLIRTKYKQWKSLEDLLCLVMARPNTVRRVAIVVSFVSKKELEAELKQFKKGNTKKQHHLQTLWLLSTFVGACRGRGAVPLIIAAP